MPVSDQRVRKLNQIVTMPLGIWLRHVDLTLDLIPLGKGILLPLETEEQAEFRRAITQVRVRVHRESKSDPDLAEKKFSVVKTATGVNIFRTK